VLIPMLAAAISNTKGKSFKVRNSSRIESAAQNCTTLRNWVLIALVVPRPRQSLTDKNGMKQIWVIRDVSLLRVHAAARYYLEQIF
jgi:hypothetical protein